MFSRPNFSMYTQGLGVALQSPPAPFRTLVCGLPTIVLAPAIFLQGFSIGPVIVAAGNVVTANAKVAEVNDISTTYFFLRQLGNSFEVTPATLMFDRRLTLHSSRLLDVCVRLDAATRSAVVQYADLIHRNGGAPAIPRWEHCSSFKKM
jgi:DHA2 family multidrug resistance protein